MFKERSPKLVNSTDSELRSYFHGELTEQIARIRLSHSLPVNHHFIDGHDPFEAPNFAAYNGTKPKNLDLVQVDRQTGNVAAIYEVKSTRIPDKKEFNVNGQCGIFMTLAASLSIPTYLLIVTLDREIRQDVLKEDPVTKKTHVDANAYLSELNYFLRNAKFELYSSDKFKISGGKFIVSGTPVLLLG